MTDHWLKKVVQILTAETKDLRELAEIAGGDPSIFYRGIDLKRLETSGQDLAGMEFGLASEVWPDVKVVDDSHLRVAHLRRSLRYEERLALLIEMLGNDRIAGLRVLRAYEADKSKHATIVLESLRDWLATENRSERATAVEIARFVRSLFAHAMPGSRAAFLFYMVKHLSSREDMLPFLRKWWSRSNSSSLAEYQREIEEILEVPRKE